MDDAATRRLESYFGAIGEKLGHDSRRKSFAIYAMGILGDGERKSVEPIAARACADPRGADAAHQSLLHFVSNARWSDEDVRRVAASHAIGAITEHCPIEAWIVDDTGLLKQLGFDHFEGRSFPGWHHHVSVVLCCYAFVIAERVRRLPPSARRPLEADAVHVAA